MVLTRNMAVLAAGAAVVLLLAPVGAQPGAAPDSLLHAPTPEPAPAPPPPSPSSSSSSSTPGAGPTSGLGEKIEWGGLARHAAAITDTGVTGVQVTATGPSGVRRTAVSGVADLATGSPVPRGGFFRIGSVNKTLVAAVVLQLHGEGLLALEDPVERWLPGVIEGNGHDGTEITLHQLLQHTSGIHDGAFPDRGGSAERYHAHRHDIHAPEDIVAAAMEHTPEFPAGGGWSYSNTGYLVLGMVIEAATGRSWQDEVEGRIVRPLGLRNTRWPGVSPGLPTPHAEGYTRFTPEGELVRTTELVDADASGGYLSTTADLDTFVRALFDGTLLDRHAQNLMRTTVGVDADTEEVWPGARYGLGIFSRPTPCGATAWIPSGDQIGYRTRAGVTDDGRSSAVVSMSTQLHDSLESTLEQEQAAVRLIDEALCDTGQAIPGGAGE